MDLQLSPGERDALLHVEQPLALAPRGAAARPGHVEALAVVAHHQLERVAGHAQLDIHPAGLKLATSWTLSDGWCARGGPNGGSI
jgi:hypothetical protein